MVGVPELVAERGSFDVRHTRKPNEPCERVYVGILIAVERPPFRSVRVSLGTVGIAPFDQNRDGSVNIVRDIVGTIKKESAGDFEAKENVRTSTRAVI